MFDQLVTLLKAIKNVQFTEYEWKTRPKVNFGTVQPGESIEKIAGHYVEDWTQIVRVSWMDNPSDNGA